MQKRTELQLRRVISGVLIGVLSTSEVFFAEVQLFPIRDEVEKGQQELAADLVRSPISVCRPEVERLKQGGSRLQCGLFHSQRSCAKHKS